jgi:hypothetical protein
MMRRIQKLAAALAAVAALSFAVPASAASGKNNYLRNKIVNQIFQGTALGLPANFAIRLYAAGSCPTATTAGTEYTGNGYAAITCTASTAGSACTAGGANWGAGGVASAAATAGSIANVNSLQFPTVTGANWSIQCVAITDATSAANVLYYGDLTGAPVTVSVGATASFAGNALVLTEQ